MYRQEKYFLAILFLVALAMRLILFYGFLHKGENYLVYFDSAQYKNIAEQIVQGHGIALEQSQPTFYRLPGYPLFLASCYACFGINDYYALLFQILLSSCIPMLIFLLAQMLVPRIRLFAKIVALISAFHIGLIMYAGILATESLFTFFFLLFLIFFYQKKFVYAGMVLGIASLIRPVGHFILPVAILGIILGSHTNSFRMRSTVSLSFSWLSVVSIWLVRNWLLTGMIFFHTLPGLHFLQYVTTKVVMEMKSCSYVQARADLLEEWKKEIEDRQTELARVLYEPEKCQIAEKITSRYCQQKPLLVFKNSLYEMIKTMCGLYSAHLIFTDTQEWSDYSVQSNAWLKLKKYLVPRVVTWYLIPLTWLEIVFVFFLLLGCVSFARALLYDAHARALALQLIPFISILLVLTCAYGCARLRLPFEPLLLIISLYGWFSLL